MAKGAPIEIEDSSDGAQVLNSAPASDTGQRALAVRVVSQLGAGTGGGGGGAVTIADGADVAQGTTTDASTANTVVGLLKAIKAAITGTLTVATHAVTQSGVWTVARSWTLSSATDSVNVGNFPATQPVSGTVAVSNFPGTQPVSGAVTADTELPAASALADTDANPTTSRVGANGLLWNGTSWDRAPGDKTNGLKVQSAQLPSALDGSGFLKVHEQGVAHIDDNSGSLTVDAPVGTPVFVRLSDGTVALLGQKTMAGSLPVAIASDQGNLPENLAAVGGTSVSLGSKVSASSIPVVVASDQGDIKVNLDQVGATAIVAKAASTFGQAALPVYPNASQRDTYFIIANNLSISMTAGGGDKALLSIEHAGTSTKTVKIRRVIVSGVCTTASAAVAGSLLFRQYGGTAASTAGTAVTPTKANNASAAAEMTAKTQTTITLDNASRWQHRVLGTGTAGVAVGATFGPIVCYDWQENGETAPITLRAGQLEAMCVMCNGLWATTGPTFSIDITIIATEE